MKHLMTILMLAGVFAHLTSCSNDDYINAIPKKVSALAEVQLPALASSMQQEVPTLVEELLGWQQFDNSGLDTDRPAIFFETTDGTFGLCVKMDDADDFARYAAEVLGTAMKKATRPVEWRNCQFALYSDKWLMGWSDDALLVMGPIVAAQQQAMQQQMATLLKQDKEKSVRQSPLYESLLQLNDDGLGRVAMQAFALPDNIAALFTMGLPKQGDPRQVVLAFDMQQQATTLRLNGSITSRNATVEKGLKAAHAIMRRIDTQQPDRYDATATAHMLFNVDGTQYLPFLRQNPAMQSLMTIANAAIDLDNIIRSIDGTCHLQLGSDSTQAQRLLLTAPLKHAQWLSDVAYWMQSTPSGATLSETTTADERGKGQRHFVLTTTKSDERGDRRQTLCFGLYAPQRLYIGTARPNDGKGKNRLADHVAATDIKALQQARLALLVNLKQMGRTKDKDAMATVAKMIKPISKSYTHLLYIYGDD